MTPFAPRRALAAAVLALALPAAALAGPAPAAAAEPAPALRVLTYNVFLMSKNLYPNWGQDHRAAEIPKASFFQGNDVVVLQEAFDNSASDALKRAAADRYPYQTPVVGRGRDGWDATGGAYSATTPEDGGVTVLSKWPVLRREQYVYRDACGADWWSNKGFAYVVLDVDGTKVHVVGTHAQSTDPGCGAGEAAQVRARQFRAVDAFLDAKNIPADEEVLVAGDLNVDSRSAEYASMLADADLAGADARTGHPYSFDTRENSVARDRYPDDPREDLDHVLPRAGHARPAGWRNEVVREQSAPWTVTSWGASYTYTNLSDHYPVRAFAG
ncbi:MULTISPECIES: sphingomyelin phosphodiesterase [Streptomyces]|uniref:Sphingomyelin phosphodiesterase n=1 Tax=Streptomyces tricolor TaxID=68277 RepID=A0ABS9JA43_9ACTN|nr:MULTISPECIES: sphingomyelin phosphodiesterase [Streptomyces]MCG0062379.1 sphingomyelin phosphodiesterase [Streptomyces tricolor]BCM72627.1 putative phospholipase [Streptomyces sp. EAS-AB2608]